MAGLNIAKRDIPVSYIAILERLAGLAEEH